LSEPIYVILPLVENQYYPSIRMGVYEHTSRQWNEALLSSLGPGLEMAQPVKNSVPMLVIDHLRLPCLLLSIPYCQVANTPFDYRVFGYGWDIYQLRK
jgi:hypothetical protein